MADIALGVSVKQNGVLETEKALDGLARAAWGTDKAVDALAASTQQNVKYWRTYGAAMGAAEGQTENFTASLVRANAALNDTPSIAGRYGAAMDGAGGATANVFAQLNDIGVMMAAGQNPIQLALQQGMQLNQVWGTMGNNVGGILRTLGSAFMPLLSPINLVTIGVIAGGAALTQWLFSAGETVDVNERAMDSFNGLADAANAYADAVVNAQTPMIGLIDQFGSQAAVAERLLDQMVRLQEFQLENALRQAQQDMLSASGRMLDDIAEMASLHMDLNAILASGERNAMGVAAANRMIAQSAADIEAEYGLGEQAAMDLYNSIQMIGAADGPYTAALATMAFVDELIKARDAGADIPPELIDVATEAAGAASAILQMAAALGLAADNAAAIVIPIGVTTGAPLTSGDGNLLPPAHVRPGTDRRPRSGGGGARRDPYKDNLERLIESLRTETEVIEEWHDEQEKLLDDRRAQEILGQDAHNQAMLRLEEEYQSRLSAVQMATEQQRLGEQASFWGAMAGIAQAGGDRLAKAAATFGAIEATVNAYRAAVAALATPGISVWGRMAAYASVLAAGLKGVAAIRQAGGIGGGSGAAGGAGAAPSAADVMPQRTVKIEFMGDAAMKSLAEKMFDQFIDLQKGGAVLTR